MPSPVCPATAVPVLQCLNNARSFIQGARISMNKITCSNFHQIIHPFFSEHYPMCQYQFLCIFFLCNNSLSPVIILSATFKHIISNYFLLIFSVYQNVRPWNSRSFYLPRKIFFFSKLFWRASQCVTRHCVYATSFLLVILLTFFLQEQEHYLAPFAMSEFFRPSETTVNIALLLWSNGSSKNFARFRFILFSKHVPLSYINHVPMTLWRWVLRYYKGSDNFRFPRFVTIMMIRWHRRFCLQWGVCVCRYTKTNPLPKFSTRYWVVCDNVLPIARSMKETNC